jgi:hypothetical protein
LELCASPPSPGKVASPYFSDISCLSESDAILGA